MMSLSGASLRQRCLQTLLQLDKSNTALILQLSGKQMSTVEIKPAYGEELLNAYKELGLKVECSKDELKEKFVELAKNYHPDTGGEKADPEKFMKVKQAYKTITAADYHGNDQQELNSVQEQFHDIKHTAPQHRQYLEYAGAGFGTPFERMKQYQQYRVQKAAHNARDYAMDKIARTYEEEAAAKAFKGNDLAVSREQAHFSKKQKTTKTIERMVEDMIQQSIKAGDFSKLKGMGKPLKDDNHNPYVDEMQHKLNKILINNGFSPPWILKEREIRDDVKTLRAEINSVRLQLAQDETEWSRNDRERWSRAKEQLREDIIHVNKAIQDFNLISPSLSRQLCHLNFDREAMRAERVFDLPPEECQEIGASGRVGSDGNISGLKSSKPELNTGGFRSLLKAMNIKKEG